MTLPCIMILCLSVTEIIEIIVALLIKLRDKKDLINVFLVNVLTNPLLVSTSYLIFIKCGATSKKIYEIILEILIFLVEGIIYQKYLKYSKINGFLVSLILNLSSYFVGGVLIDLVYKQIINAMFLL